jgi:hypothetical protein
MIDARRVSGNTLNVEIRDHPQLPGQIRSADFNVFQTHSPHWITEITNELNRLGVTKIKSLILL